MLARLCQNWVYGAALLAPILLVLAPLFELDGAVFWGFVALPVYMLHQYEEHDDDRFRVFVNRLLGSERAGLSPLDVMVINVVGVWVVITASIWMASIVDPGWVLVPAYLLAINGIIHVAQALGMREYNPGLATAVLFFLPLAAICFAQAAPTATAAQHAVSAGSILALHAAILAWALRARG